MLPNVHRRSVKPMCPSVRWCNRTRFDIRFRGSRKGLILFNPSDFLGTITTTFNKCKPTEAADIQLVKRQVKAYTVNDRQYMYFIISLKIHYYIIKILYHKKFFFDFAMRSDIKNDALRANSFSVPVFRISVF
jgi:hypothetical protein